MRESLIRMALGENTLSSKAVLHSLLAFSQLHREGCQLQTYKYVKSALHSLSSSAAAGMSKHEASQHISAGMILCSGHVSFAHADSKDHFLTDY